MNDPLVADLTARLDSLGPMSILLVGEDGPGALAPYLDSHPACVLEVVAWADVGAWIETLDRRADRARYDLALVVWSVASSAPSCAPPVLARLRDLLARQLWVLTTLEDPKRKPEPAWTSAGLVALGLTRAGAYTDRQPPLHLYTFDLASYKTTPQWLSPKDWAHPERWDKERW